MKIVLSLGRLHPLKGLDLLIAAWAEVKKCGNAGETPRARPSPGRSTPEGEADPRRECANESSWQLVIAGANEQGTQEKLKVKSEKLKLKMAEISDLASGCDADILFMGPVHGDEKWTLMQRADIFVLPSRSENFGMVVGEALSCGVPVVTTAVGPWGEGEREVCECVNPQMREWERGAVGASDRSPVLMEKRGLIVVETSVEGIAEGLLRMMALSDAERKEIGSKGCAWVKREFSWESVAQQMLEAYNIEHIKA